MNKSGDPKDIAIGRQLLQKGQVGTLVVAGGMGTRLGWNGPKGTFPLTRFKHKTLFDLLLEKRRAASQLYKAEQKLCVMTSPLNHEASARALGSEVDLFQQEMVPLLDENKQLTELLGPSGNGSALHLFYKSGLWKKWKEAGIKYIHFLPIDNPLADPFDPNLCGFHERSGADVTIKVIERLPNEQMGLLREENGKLTVIEYTELPPEAASWKLAHITLFCFSMDFIERIHTIPLPWHYARKTVQGRNILKPETFIFDLLPLAHHPKALLYPREKTYAPLKNAHGINSPETVREALLQSDRRQYQAVTGVDVSDQEFELSPDFYYPSLKVLEKWKNKPLPREQYIDVK